MATPNSRNSNADELLRLLDLFCFCFLGGILNRWLLLLPRKVKGRKGPTIQREYTPDWNNVFSHCHVPHTFRVLPEILVLILRDGKLLIMLHYADVYKTLINTLMRLH